MPFGSPNLPAVINPIQEMQLANIGSMPASALAPTPMGPLESVMAIFEEMRDGINTLVGIATQQLSSEIIENRRESLIDTDDDDGDDMAGEKKPGMIQTLKEKMPEGIGAQLLKLGLLAGFMY
jgi:hypothetical protein